MDFLLEIFDDLLIEVILNKFIKNPKVPFIIRLICAIIFFAVLAVLLVMIVALCLEAFKNNKLIGTGLFAVMFLLLFLFVFKKIKNKKINKL